MKSKIKLVIAFLLFISSTNIQAQDIYGGYTKIKKNATGFFRLEEQNGKHFLITPNGNPFFALSVVHLSTVKAPGQDIVKNLKECNYTCAGYNIPKEYPGSGVDTLTTMFPYFIEIYVSGPRKNIQGTSHQIVFYDIFDPSIAAKNEAMIKKTCTLHYKNPFLLGYYLMDIPIWSIERGRLKGGIDYPAYMKKLPATAPGKIAYVEFLKSKYANNIGSLNTAYKTSFSSFEDVLTHNFPNLSEKNSQEYVDDIEFEGVIADKYYSICTQYVRKYDPNHLIFGDKYKVYSGEANPFADESVLRAAAKYVDLISVEAQFCSEFFPAPNADFAKIHQITGKPIMIGDVDFCSSKTNFDEYLVDRATQYGTYLGHALSTGYIIGLGKCMYFDRPSETTKRGLVNPDNTLRSAFSDIITKSNKENLTKAYESIKNAK